MYFVRWVELMLLRSTLGTQSFAFLCILDWCMHPDPHRGEYHMLATKAIFESTNDFCAVSRGHIRRQQKEGQDDAVRCGWQALAECLFLTCLCSP